MSYEKSVKAYNLFTDGIKIILEVIGAEIESKEKNSRFGGLTYSELKERLKSTLDEDTVSKELDILLDDGSLTSVERETVIKKEGKKAVCYEKGYRVALEHLELFRDLYERVFIKVPNTASHT